MGKGRTLEVRGICVVVSLTILLLIGVCGGISQRTSPQHDQDWCITHEIQDEWQGRRKVQSGRKSVAEWERRTRMATGPGDSARGLPHTSLEGTVNKHGICNKIMTTLMKSSC